MADKPRDLLLQYLNRYYETQLLLGQSFYALNSRAVLYFRYSRLHQGATYFFGVESDDLARFESRNTFILFICGDEVKVIVLPVEDFLDMVSGTTPVSNQWKILIRESDGKWLLRVAGKGQFDVSGFLNFYDFTSGELKRDQSPSLGELIPLGKKRLRSAEKTPSVIEDADLAAELVRSVRDSSRYSVFEKNVARALNELGLDAQQIGAPGSTDVLVTAPFRAVVECKSTTSGSLTQVNFTRIKRHQSNHNAHTAAVVSEHFDPAVVQDASMEGVALLTTAALAELLRLNLAFPVGSEQLQTLFHIGGLVREDDLSDIRSYVSRMTMLSQKLAQVLDALDSTERPIEEIKGRLEGRSGEEYGITELSNILNFLSEAVFDVVSQEPTGFRLRLNPALAKRRIKAVVSALMHG